MSLSSTNPVVLVLAAGRGERFVASGGAVHKLQALLAGKRVIDHVLDAVKTSGLPYHVVTPDASRPGMGDSIAAGIRATPGATAWLILPADLPLISPSTLRAVAFAAPCAVAIPVYKGQRGHPVRFGFECAEGLVNLQGNQGAAVLIQAQKAIDSIALIEVNDIGCVTDIDTLQDLARAEALLASRPV
jgi:molybdenum cofactor cytidylyltransferase